MGNRAVIHPKGFSTGIYLHWNGGRASVEGILSACRELGYCDPEGDPSYALARMVNAASVLFGLTGCESIGIGSVEELDYNNMDNGVYIIGAGWKIVERKHFNGVEEVNQKKTDGIKTMIVQTLRVADDFNFEAGR